jgi:DNA-binding NarL/FixJ family response regulator
LLDRSSSVPTDARALPSCSLHPASLVRRYRSHGPNGPGVYPQCVPGGNEQPHLLGWADAGAAAPQGLRVPTVLTQSEREVLGDAAHGFTVRESAKRRHKSTETVKTQRKRIMLKLGARNITQAVGIAVSQAMLAEHAA